MIKTSTLCWVAISLFILFIVGFFAQPDFCIGMGFSGRSMNNKSVVVLKKQDSGKEIDVKRGDVIQIELEGMGGAGYAWYLGDLDTQYIELLSQETKVLSGGRIGAPVLGIWRFSVKEKGTTQIGMDHYRQWEGVGKSTDHFWIKLNIR